MYGGKRKGAFNIQIYIVYLFNLLYITQASRITIRAHISFREKGSFVAVIELFNDY